MNTIKFSLDNAISKRILDKDKGWIDFSPVITEKHVENFVSLFGHGCRHETKRALRVAAKNGFSGIKNCGILRRVEFNDHGPDSVSYCAGQDYPSEIAIVRNHIKKYY